ncbi:head-tail connector protein [Aurantiacibacter marinus]|uniref:PhiE125 gp8 family phage protein n=1 Tax=Aurantiacibacter marinus TaxID=874156 RepID=A0A0H0XSB1_9SPHN|nr:hypothetical protein [Aurantiacibacter marinus]KLI64861.1 hypothetical protein AAV99_04970 [Aurantiacibacter marinus]
MRRKLISSPTLSVEALDELKQWLAITTTRDDAALTALLRSSLDTCEGFTRQIPLSTSCEEVLPATRGWHDIATTPVQAITSLVSIGSDGTRTDVDPGHYLFDITADGCGRINLLAPPAENRVAVRFTAGLASDWNTLPEGLRHGMIRLASYAYRERNEGSTSRSPPAAIAALWQPWRRMRIA